MTYICIDCIRDAFLRGICLLSATDENPCDYCDSDEFTAALSVVTDACDQTLTLLFEPSHQTSAVLLFDYPPEGNDLEGTLRTLNALPEDAIEDLAEALTDRWTCSDTMEGKYGDDPWFTLKQDYREPISDEWAAMEVSLRYETRFLNQTVMEMLEDVFLNVDGDRTHDGQSVIVDIQPGSTLSRFYRARVFQTEKALHEALQSPERLLGTPAPGVGPAGRMNAKGQPAFYGATVAQTAIAEVRPPVGCWVSVAAFDVTRPLRLLDLSALANICLDSSLSFFDPNSVRLAHRRDFLRKLSQRMTKPVMPELQEHDYLITQVIADYLSAHASGELDGIVFASAQAGSDKPTGKNVVLFPKASRVVDDDADRRCEVKLWEYDEDGPQRDFMPEIYLKQSVKRLPEFQHLSRNPALRLVTTKIVIHEILRVEFEAATTGVSVRSECSTAKASDT